MNTNLRALPGQFKELFERLTTTQKLTLVTLTVFTLLSIVILLVVVNRPQYTILYSELSSSDAASVRDQLQDAKIPYQLRNGGTTILVPKDRVYDLRLQLAAKGIPEQPGVGYEIFDRTNLGMSDFVQKLNYRRALEGELARTVSSISEVEQARVHVVIPEPALFKQDEKQTTASVVLKMKPHTRLQENQIRGISILVSRAVEGLLPENVTILDSYGNLLSGDKSPDPMVGLSATQMELQQKVEAYLASKAQSMLDRVLGPGKSIVRVSSELDFQTIERTREIYDPESAVVRSEERTETETTGGNSPQSKQENSLSNYEINKTVEHLVDSGGSILRLSVAVMVDGHYETAEDGSLVYQPRTPEEMQSLSAMVKGALGLQEERGDVLQITNIAFDKEGFEQQPDTWNNPEMTDLLITLLPKIILGVVLLSLLLMIRGILKRHLSVTKQALETGGMHLSSAASGAPAALLPADGGGHAMIPATEIPNLSEDIPDDVRESEAKKEAIAKFAEEKPEAATMLLRSWLLET
jgi:flagellar M-ring protein FliF